MRFVHGDQMYRGTCHFYYTILKPIVTGFLLLTFAKDLNLKENHVTFLNTTINRFSKGY